MRAHRAQHLDFDFRAHLTSSSWRASRIFRFYLRGVVLFLALAALFSRSQTVADEYSSCDAEYKKVMAIITA